MYAIFYTEDNDYGGNLEHWLGLTYHTKEMARRDWQEQMTNLSQHEKANEYQPTETNGKDLFHFYVKQEDGTEQKRGMFISRFYTTPKYSLRTIIDAKEKALKHRLIRSMYED